MRAWWEPDCRVPRARLGGRRGCAGDRADFRFPRRRDRPGQQGHRSSGRLGSDQARVPPSLSSVQCPATGSAVRQGRAPDCPQPHWKIILGSGRAGVRGPAASARCQSESDTSLVLQSLEGDGGSLESTVALAVVVILRLDMIWSMVMGLEGVLS